MTNNQQIILKSVSDLRTTFEKAARRYLDEVAEENERFLKDGIGGVINKFFMLLSLPVSNPSMLLHNYCYQAVGELEKIEGLLKQIPPDGTAVAGKLQALKASFDENAKYLKKDMRFNPIKGAKRAAEFRAYSKKVDELLGLM